MKPWVFMASAFVASVTTIAEASFPGAYQLRHSLDPIILVIQAGCYPIGVILMFWGVLKWALDDPNGLKLLRKGAILIVAAYWIPWLADLASQIGAQSAPVNLQPPIYYQPSGR